MNPIGVVLVALVCLFGTDADAASKEDDLVARLAGPPAISSMVIAPGGQHLAGVSHEGTLASVFVTEVATMKSRQLVPSYPVPLRLGGVRYVVPQQVAWLNTDLLVVAFSDGSSQSFRIDNSRPLVDLGNGYIRRAGELDADARSDWVLAWGESGDSDIIRMNARTGDKERFWVPLSGSLVQCAFDGAGHLRAVTMSDTAFWSDKTTLSHWYRDSPKGEWQLIARAPQSEELWAPLFVPDEPNRMVVAGRFGRDTRALYLFDTNTKQPVELLAAHDREDIEEVMGLALSSFVSVRTGGMKPSTIWFDGRWAALQKAVDTVLPGLVNTLSGNKSGRVLIHSHSDVEPGRWHLLDTQTMSMREVARTHLDLSPNDMAPMQVVDYPSRDGLRIPAYLTRPRGAKAPTPAIVFIHGGPHVRDHWMWDSEVQLLAARGYTVLQPQFRGSTGFGLKFLEAGYGQWGLGMQDDITAGVEYLVRQGLVDPTKVCIYGASYGGYAALWGLVSTPQLYRCGVSLAGVSDIERMLTESSLYNRHAAVRDLLRHRIGDRAVHQQQFAELSPLRQAQRVKVPVLLAHGDEDDIVPIGQSKRMVEALKANGKQVEWLELVDDHHGFSSVASRQAYLRKLLDFFDRHLGASVKTEPGG